MESDWAEALDDLRWHWGDAYMIYRAGPEHWIALRRDNFECVRGTSSEQLLGLIRADYEAFPVQLRVNRPEVKGGAVVKRFTTDC